MIEVFPFQQLGSADHGWLSAHFHFSFADYQNSDRMGLGPLRVWNDDQIKGGTGFPMHPHKDMEIITYLRSGAISHEDNMGNKGRTVAGDVQVMSAGTGVFHSEYNLEEEDTTLFQIWIYPDKRNYEPRWESRKFPVVERDAHLSVLASGRVQDQETDALMIHQDAALLAATLKAGQTVEREIGPERAVYLVPAVGSLKLNGETDIPERAGVSIVEETTIHIEALEDAEIVLVDVPYPWHPRQVIS
ncbi:MAG: hypothetical protein HON65_11325 [Rhodospirillales bacterium]|jgi:quercetin 2,3-dioxygenase|nr:hypothetical protein [Rhodospirillales bacterium]